MTGTFSVYGVVYDGSTGIVMGWANVVAWKNGGPSHGVNVGWDGQYDLSDIESGDTI